MKDYFLDENHINADTEIDLVELFFTLLRHWKMVLCSALAGGILFCAYTMFLMTPMYTSTSSVLILTKETTLASLADLQMGSQLTNDYSVLITSRPVLEDVIKNLKLDMEYRDLANCISVNNPTDTRILEISVTYPSATQSAKRSAGSEDQPECQQKYSDRCTDRPCIELWNRDRKYADG